MGEARVSISPPERPAGRSRGEPTARGASGVRGFSPISSQGHDLRSLAPGAVLGLRSAIGNRALTRRLAQDGAHRRLQRMKIGSLKVDTTIDGKDEVLKALLACWKKSEFTVAFTAEEAQELLRVLLDVLPTEPREGLEALVSKDEEEQDSSEGEQERAAGGVETKWWEGDSDEERASSRGKVERGAGGVETKWLEIDSDEERTASSAEEERVSSGSEEDLFNPARQLFEKPRSPSKADVAQGFVRAMAELGLHVYLAGGAAVSLSGSKRAIKDLDFRIEIDCTFKPDDELGQPLIASINKKVRSVFKGRVGSPFEVSDEATGYTIKSMLSGCEVSVTRTPLVSYLAHGQRSPRTITVAGEPFSIAGEAIPTLGGFDLILDKAYSLVMRRQGDHMKRISDLFDLLFVLDGTGGGFHGGCQVLRFLDLQRGEAYRLQAARANKRAGAPVFEGSLVLQLLDVVSALAEDHPRDIRELFKDVGALKLLGRIEELQEELEEILRSPMPSDII